MEKKQEVVEKTENFIKDVSIESVIEKIEYIRKNNRKIGRKKGVLWAGINPHDGNSVIVGFTLCHSVDRFDYISKRKKIKGFGLKTAKIRAEKWRDHDNYFVQKTYNEEEFEKALEEEDVEILKYVNPDKKSTVEVPPSVMVKLKPFIERCRKYYKDKKFPIWINKIEKDQPLTELETEPFFNKK